MTMLAVVQLVDRVLCDDRTMTENDWDLIDAATLELSPLEVGVLERALLELGCGLTCSFAPLRHVDTARFARIFLDNGRWMDSLARAGTAERRRRAAPASAAKAAADAAWARFRLRRRREDEAFVRAHVDELARAHPAVRWDDVPATAGACAALRLVDMADGPRRASLHLLARHPSWRDVYEGELARAFAASGDVAAA